MQYRSTDPDIATLISRIDNGDLKLQPDFQRGEVWSLEKKKKLIDTLLRNWQIPPIHVIEVLENNSDEVLDGQQRLVAIRDFFKGKFRIDGNIQPIDKEIQKLDGYKYEDLEDRLKRKLNKSPLRVFTIIDYTPEETAELFYRLNQPTALTSAEQRNAFYGTARSQIKQLVQIIDIDEGVKKRIGFTNSRMAYDDIISKFCFSIECGTLKNKLTSSDIAEKYRSVEGYSDEAIIKTKIVLDTFVNIIKEVQNNLRLNKATVFSWLCFISRYLEERQGEIISYRDLAIFMDVFEEYRKRVKNIENGIKNISFLDEFYVNNDAFERLILLFNQKCSMGSTDASSIIIRDIILWYFYYKVIYPTVENGYLDVIDTMKTLDDMLKDSQNVVSAIEIFMKAEAWGEVI